MGGEVKWGDIWAATLFAEEAWKAWVRCLVGFAQGSVDDGRPR
jgi:hypothetical protein